MPLPSSSVPSLPPRASRRPRAPRLLALLSALLLTPAAAPAQTPLPVDGQVLDASEAPVPDAVVIATCGGASLNGTTNGEGRFTISLPPGPCAMEAVKPGFTGERHEVTVAPGLRPITLRLAVAQVAENVTVVSAAAVERSLRDAPASVSVVTSEQLASKPVRDLADMLAMVEGVTARRSGNQVPGIQVRGLDSAYTLMLIDGRRVNSTSASFRGNDYDTGWVPASAIERIEVVRGPMSSLYGSDAIGGVVNIITRRVGQAWTGSATGSLNLQENRDAGDAYVANAALFGPIVRDVLGVKLYAGFDRRAADSAGVNAPPPGASVAQPGFPVNDNRFAAADLAWVADRRNDMTLHYDRSRRDHGGFLIERQAGSFEHKGTWGPTTSSVLVYGDETRNLVGTVTGQVNPNRATLFVTEGKLNLPFAAHVVTVGGQYRRERLDDPTNLAGLPGTPAYGADPTTMVRQAAVFAEADFALGPRLRLTVGDRFDHHENFGGNNSPRVYAVYHAGAAVTLKAGVARAFRAPTLLQNSPNWGSPSCGSVTNGCFIVGSRELEPETSTSVEAGVQVDRGAWGGGVTYFRNDLDNMIDITSRTTDAALAPSYPNFIGFLPAGPPGYGRAIFRYQNINHVRTQGVESSIRYSPSARWRLRANYGYLQADNLSGAAPLPLVYRPAHTVTTWIDWLATDALSVVGTLRATSAQYVSVPVTGVGAVSRGGYGIADVTLAYRVARALTLRGGVLNVADTTLARDTSNDFNEEGRRYFLGFSTQF